MTVKSKKKHPQLSQSSGTGSRHERAKANPESKNLRSAKEVWKEAETTPQPTKHNRGEGPVGRVADRGDLAEKSVSPYSTDIQADAVAKQTKRNETVPMKQKRNKR